MKESFDELNKLVAGLEAENERLRHRLRELKLDPQSDSHHHRRRMEKVIFLKLITACAKCSGLRENR